MEQHSDHSSNLETTQSVIDPSQLQLQKLRMKANNLDSDVQCSHSKDSVNSASKSSSLVADVEDEGKELDSCVSSSSHLNNSQD